MNIVHHVIHIEGSKEEIEKFKDAVRATVKVHVCTSFNENGEVKEYEQRELDFAFSKIIPLPEGTTIEEIDDTWLLNNWCSLSEPFSPYFEDITDTHVILNFDTGGGFPGFVYLKMVEKFARLKFYGTSWEEMGHFEYKMNGSEITEVPPAIGMARMEAANDDIGDCVVIFTPSDTEDGDSSYQILKVEEDDLTGYTFRMTDEEIVDYNLWNEAGRNTIEDEYPANDDVPEFTNDPFANPNESGKM